LEIHLDPNWGSTYWLQRQERLTWSIQAEIQEMKDVWKLGLLPVSDLRKYPVKAFIPKRFHHLFSQFILGETAGTSGEPCATAFRNDEFQEAFITPFLKVADATHFPKSEPWLWLGPSGPHIIGKVVRELARQSGSMDPFSVDFDPRWVKRLAEGSMARDRYLQHVISQALDILNREEIGILFTTPPTLKALAERMTDRQRESLHGIHYGGMSISPQTLNDFKLAFPAAVHLSGYGNSLFGVVMETVDTYRSAMDYYPLGERVIFQVIEWDKNDSDNERFRPVPCDRGQPGRLLVHRLDESCLLLNVLERDQAERVAPVPAAIALGGISDGLRNPQVPPQLAKQLQLGIY
jgi:hypothetical protein